MSAAHVSVRIPSGDLALTLATMKQLVFDGPFLDIVYINAIDDIYLIIANGSQDGDPLPAGNAQRYRIPAGVCHPYRTTKDKVFLAPVSAATTTAWVVALPSERFPWETGAITDPCR